MKMGGRYRATLLPYFPLDAILFRATCQALATHRCGREGPRVTSSRADTEGTRWARASWAVWLPPVAGHMTHRVTNVGMRYWQSREALRPRMELDATGLHACNAVFAADMKHRSVGMAISGRPCCPFSSHVCCKQHLS